jgi:hypothetical protein
MSFTSACADSVIVRDLDPLVTGILAEASALLEHAGAADAIEPGA